MSCGGCGVKVVRCGVVGGEFVVLPIAASSGP